jgi:hypothetical protein
MDVFGQDIKMGDDGRPLVAANGELILTRGTETGVQDVRLRLETPLGELFYDAEDGSLIHECYLDEGTGAGRAGFEAEVQRRIEEDPRVVLGSASCTAGFWDAKGFTANASWTFIDEDNPFNLVIGYDSSNREMVIKDVNPRTGL